MKKLMVLALGFAFAFGLALTVNAQTDGCYLCQGGGYVKFRGADSSEKRKKAEKIGCKVNGTTSSCSNPKGTVD